MAPNNFHNFLDYKTKQENVVEKGFMVLDTKKLWNLDIDQMYQKLLDKKIDNITTIRFTRKRSGFYEGDLLEKHSWFGKYGKDYFDSNTPKDNYGNILSDIQIGELAMRKYDGMASNFNMTYWSDFEDTFTTNTLLNLDACYSILNNGDSVDGVSTTYSYAGRNDSVAAMHEEDDGLLSVNICLIGIKVWIILNREETEKLKIVLRNEFKTYSCKSFWKHKCAIITPHFLKKRNIKYSVVYQKPGMAIVTNIHCFHQVINVTQTLAVARNIATESWVDIPTHDRCYCNESPRFDKKLLQTLLKYRRENDQLWRENLELKSKRKKDDINDIAVQTDDNYMFDTDSIPLPNFMDVVEKSFGQLNPSAITYRCKECDWVSYSSHRQSLDQHMRSEHSGIRFKCENCSHHFKRKDVMRKHSTTCAKRNMYYHARENFSYFLE